MATAANRVDRALLRGVSLARQWAAQLETGEIASIRELAQRNNLCVNYTSRLLPLAYLAPDILETILQGNQPRTASLSDLIAVDLPADWAAQRRIFARLGIG